jgi:DNA polymerase
MLVGEQPSDQEDKRGRPFVGPAGRVLDESLRAARIPREEVYITNAVKHFKHHRDRKRRLHDKPNAAEMRACRPWLDAEVDVVNPEILSCLGATAAKSVIGGAFQLTRDRGVFVVTPWCARTVATFHPSAVLRALAHDGGDAIRHRFVEDLVKVRAALDEIGREHAPVHR